MKRHRISDGTLGLLGLLAALAVWELVGDLHVINPLILVPVHSVVQAGIALAQAGTLWVDVVVSVRELLIGFALAVVAGVPLGALMGFSRTVDQALQPIVWFLYSAPLIAFYPVFIVWLGLGLPTIVAITVLVAVFPIMVNTSFAVRSVDPVLRRCASSFGYTPVQSFWRVTVPASLPTIIAGLRLGAGRAMIGVFVGEFFGAQSGLGYLISYSGAVLKTGDMFVALVLVIAIGVIATQLLRLVEERAGRWRPRAYGAR